MTTSIGSKTLAKPAFWFAALAPVLMFFALGCGGSSSTFHISIPTATPTPSATPTPAPSSISGGVHSAVNGGEIPIVGATVTLYAAGTSGYGSTPSSLGSTTTDSAGNFAIPSFSCPSPNAQIYLVAAGGKITGSNLNSGIKLMTALGACSTLPAATDIDELTTVASVYTLSYFINSNNPQQVGAPTTNTIGIANAASIIPNLVNFADGTTATFLSSENNSPETIDSLANILAYCVESSVVSGSTSTQCTTLFGLVVAPPSAGAPSDTLGAALDIARNPAVNVNALFNLQTSETNPPFQPALTAAPDGWTLSLNYKAIGANLPRGIAIDGGGNVWIANFGGNSVSAFSAAGGGTMFSGFPVTTGLNQPFGIAIDSVGNAWVTNSGNDTLSEITPKGVAAAPIANNGLNTPEGVAIDPSNNVWVANANGFSVSAFNSKGNPLSGSPFNGGGLSTSNVNAVAIDARSNVWTANNGSLSELSPTGSPISPSGLGFIGGGVLNAKGVAIDALGNAWANNTGSKGIGGVSEFNSSGMPISPAVTGFTGGGQNGTGVGIAIDSADNAWSTNAGPGGISITETSNAGTPISGPNGFPGAGLTSPNGIAIDLSGNVWTTNAGDNSVTVLLGAASPVLTPLVACELQNPPTTACRP